ncbi:hypothetical protein [Rothia halotolerans]|uniref:hypothetical protein n=1 Tax=Rothia halotolerans TaxID=405770 RepID=UPI00101DFF95|nr:hypothetical protein [Rothia halotolerans]
MREFDVVLLAPDSAHAYRRWLDGDPAGIPLAAEAPEPIAYVLSPMPWTFWLGVGLASAGRLTPVLTFKNAVPVMDLPGDPEAPEPLNPLPLAPALRRRMDARLLIHNPGLGGFLEEIREATIERLAGDCR